MLIVYEVAVYADALENGCSHISIPNLNCVTNRSHIVVRSSA